MPSLHAAEPERSPPATLPAALGLRICGSARDGQVIRLQSRKITIGGARGCVLRIRDAEAAPLHCLILRTGPQTIVRRCSPDTRLNGATFDIAALAPGDRLGIGPLELEVIEEACPSAGGAHVG